MNIIKKKLISFILNRKIKSWYKTINLEDATIIPNKCAFYNKKTKSYIPFRLERKLDEFLSESWHNDFFNNIKDIEIRTLIKRNPPI